MSETTTGLREWARGNYAMVAAAEMLIRGFGGRFAGAGYPWIKADGDRYWIDFETLFTEAIDGPYSGGESRFLAAAASIGGMNHPVSLYEVVEMGREQLDLLLAALAHAAGSHEHSAVEYDEDGTPTGFTRPGTLYPWPELPKGT